MVISYGHQTFKYGGHMQGGGRATTCKEHIKKPGYACWSTNRANHWILDKYARDPTSITRSLRMHPRGTPVKLEHQAWICFAASTRTSQLGRTGAMVSVFAKNILRRADETQVSRVKTTACCGT
jgi:hypothetical protein